MKYVKEYMIGDPPGGAKRGRDQFGYVQCMSWYGVSRESPIIDSAASIAPPVKFPVWKGGCCIGYTRNLTEAKKIILADAVADIKGRLASAEDEVKRCKAALEQLGADPRNLGHWKVGS